MKYFIRPFLICSSLLLTVNLFGHVELTYPEGGETFVAGQTITIRWVEVQMHDTQGWHIFYSKDAGQTWIPIQENIPYGGSLEHDWEIPDFASSQTRIKVRQENIVTSYEDTSPNFTVMQATSVAGNFSKLKDLIVVSPVPAGENVTISTSQPYSQPVDWRLIDLNGILVDEEEHITLPYTIGIHHLGSGLYIIRIETESGIAYRKIVVR